MAGLARQRLAGFGNVKIETSAFEEWDDRGRGFDLLVAASAWHWVDPSAGWRRAHEVLRPGGWMALLGNVVVRRPGKPEVYAETADLHERFSPGNPDWGHPPLEDEVLATDEGWGPDLDPGGMFGPTIVRWYPAVQWLEGDGFADLLRSMSPYRRLDRDVREPPAGRRGRAHPHPAGRPRGAPLPERSAGRPAGRMTAGKSPAGSRARRPSAAPVFRPRVIV